MRRAALIFAPLWLAGCDADHEAILGKWINEHGSLLTVMLARDETTATIEVEGVLSPLTLRPDPFGAYSLVVMDGARVELGPEGEGLEYFTGFEENLYCRACRVDGELLVCEATKLIVTMRDSLGISRKRTLDMPCDWRRESVPRSDGGVRDSGSRDAGVEDGGATDTCNPPVC